jgi:hypothetical protein
MLLSLHTNSSFMTIDIDIDIYINDKEKCNSPFRGLGILGAGVQRQISLVLSLLAMLLGVLNLSLSSLP